jgi:glycosyltransferase involved in cell wall biosynthesis
MEKIFLSVVIPTYNEEINLKRGVLGSVYEYLSKQKYTWEVLVVDDGSTDKTADIEEKFVNDHKGFRLHREPHRGKGGTVIAGMLKAKGENILFTDTDQSTPIDQIEKFLPKLKNGYDVVIGSRSGRKGAPIIRKAMALGWMILRTIILRLPYKDTQCGFKVFKKDAARDIFKRMKIYSENTRVKGASVHAAFDLEFLYIARKLKLKIAEVPVECYEYGERREVSPFKDSWEGLSGLIRVRYNALLGRYKI